MALLVALTGIVATMPYIALQLVGISAVLKVLGVTGHLPLIVAFTILAVYTYNSGPRAPALIADDGRRLPTRREQTTPARPPRALENH